MAAPTATDLMREILRFVAQSMAAQPPDLSQAFDQLALKVFVHQYRNNEPYKKLCRSQKISTRSLSHWKEAPLVPTAAFREVELISFPRSSTVQVFETSGTTSEKRGRHLLRTFALYETSILPHFASMCLPDRIKPPMRVLGSPPEELPESSLSYMMGLVIDRLGAYGSRFFVRGGALDHRGLAACLVEDARRDVPVFLLGTAFGFVQFLERTGSRTWQLPSGSRVLETGGYKGLSTEIPRGEFYDMLQQRLGVAETHIISEYGMTELMSQLYDDCLRRHHLGLPPGRALIPPPWCAVRIVDPDTLQDVPQGERGLFAFYDLANLDSVAAIVTMDLGEATEAGFLLHGRLEAAPERGCSRLVDSMIGG